MDALAVILPERAFGFRVLSFVADHTRQLVLDIADIPEPPVLLLAPLAGAALFLRRLRRIQR